MRRTSKQYLLSNPSVIHAFLESVHLLENPFIVPVSASSITPSIACWAEPTGFSEDAVTLAIEIFGVVTEIVELTYY